MTENLPDHEFNQALKVRTAQDTSGVKPDPTSCFDQSGGALMKTGGLLWICDASYHRLQGWKKMPTKDNTPADWLIGQKDFNAAGRYGKTDVSAASVIVPTGTCACGDGMAVVDAWNYRVLIWKTPAEDNNAPAVIVLAQVGFTSNQDNHGNDHAAANSMRWPYGVAWQGGHLFVANSDNNRISPCKLAV